MFKKKHFVFSAVITLIRKKRGGELFHIFIYKCSLCPSKQGKCSIKAYSLRNHAAFRNTTQDTPLSQSVLFPPYRLIPSRADSGIASVELPWICQSNVANFLLGTRTDPGTHLDYSTNCRLLQISIPIFASSLDSEALKVGQV